MGGGEGEGHIGGRGEAGGQRHTADEAPVAETKAHDLHEAKLVGIIAMDWRLISEFRAVGDRDLMVRDCCIRCHEEIPMWSMWSIWSFGLFGLFGLFRLSGLFGLFGHLVYFVGLVYWSISSIWSVWCGGT